jgi:hypothetical protein
LVLNVFSGTIPSQLGSLSTLGKFRASHSPLNIYDTEYAPFRSAYFSLTSNKLTGTVPSELGGLTRLRDLKLTSNRLTGSIPPEVCQLAGDRLDVLLVDCEDVSCSCCGTCG